MSAWAIIPHTTHLWQAYRRKPEGQLDAPLLRSRLAKGEVFYQKETFAYVACAPDTPGAFLGRDRNISNPRGDEYFHVVYVADVAERYWEPPTAKSPLHMPAWASRYFAQVTEVRCERLQEITEEDARAEGCFALGDVDCTAARQFEVLWESINGPRSWAANPWVWVIGFRRVAA